MIEALTTSPKMCYVFLDAWMNHFPELVPNSKSVRLVEPYSCFRERIANNDVLYLVAKVALKGSVFGFVVHPADGHCSLLTEQEFDSFVRTGDVNILPSIGDLKALMMIGARVIDWKAFRGGVAFFSQWMV